MAAMVATNNLEAQGFAGSIALRASRQDDSTLLRTQPTPAAAFFAARRTFLKGQRLDMQKLARQLGISRVTLYRWTGDRNHLLGDVLWSLSDDLFVQAETDNPLHTGPERLLAVYRQHVGAIARAQQLQNFLQAETHSALRILTARDGAVHHRTVMQYMGLFAEEQEAGVFRPRTDLLTLAYAVVRVTEGFIYNDAILAVVPEVERAASVLELLLSESP